MPVTYFSLFSPLLSLAVYSPLSVCAKDLSGFHLFVGTLSLSSLYLFILGKLKCSKHTPIEEYESCLTALYKPPITSHHSSPSPQSDPDSPTSALLSFPSVSLFTSFCLHFTKLLSFTAHIIFTSLCGCGLVCLHPLALCKALCCFS